ncbi:hypothetical protein SAMN02745148_00324 [Modicisalibacter ilicicola DSM 19980]|uniref:Uncharacterized protein n=1 Tax=Modicisalibacter ilicicola DSM 19980 TaxID=1121942 RepID=A0A1M4T3T4_9GAMM|nr:hypothetical protein [Halomonas ilicicola]SHE38988.1 hypothetical protein SAMN02745148_00324 [Halomonas ilicicola DSM 19980]
MRDLYKRLNIGPFASDEEVATAVEACQHTALKSEALAVLNVKARREEYDRLHGLLCDIGRLRARLGLTHGANWQGDVANDFSLKPDVERSRHDHLMEKLSQAAALYDTYQRWRRHCPWIVAGGFATITLLTLGIGFLSP